MRENTIGTFSALNPAFRAIRTSNGTTRHETPATMAIFQSASVRNRILITGRGMTGRGVHFAAGAKWQFTKVRRQTVGGRLAVGPLAVFCHEACIPFTLVGQIESYRSIHLFEMQDLKVEAHGIWRLETAWIGGSGGTQVWIGSLRRWSLRVAVCGASWVAAAPAVIRMWYPRTGRDQAKRASTL
jgi:hypothetical protein